MLCLKLLWWLQVIAPYDAEDARGLLKASIRDPDPVVFLENEILYGETFQVLCRMLHQTNTLFACSVLFLAVCGISAKLACLLPLI